jgi:DNA polymerase-3 subunit chi
MTEVLFYHLDRQPLDAVLPGLIEKSLERGWRVVVHAGTGERVEALDQHLWTYRDDSFLPHGTSADGSADAHPVWLTAGDDNPNRAAIRFLVDGADIARFEGYERIVVLFDGQDTSAVERARAAWKRAKASGAACTYWQQSAGGRWEKKA